MHTIDPLLMRRRNVARALLLALTLTGMFLYMMPTALATSAATFKPYFLYRFDNAGTVYEAPSAAQSSSPYFWIKSGAKLIIKDGHGETVQGALQADDPWRKTYATAAAVQSDNGSHPQNSFELLTRYAEQNFTAQAYFDRRADHLTNTANRHPYNHEAITARWQDDNNYYYGALRADGLLVIKKKQNGSYTTLASTKLLPGSYDASNNYDLIPLDKWIGLQLTVEDTANGTKLTLATDVGWTGTWTPKLSVTDTAPIAESGYIGLTSDYADTAFDQFVIKNLGDSVSAAAQPENAVSSVSSSSYDSTVLADSPAMYLTMSSPQSGTELDQSGNGNAGTYRGGTPDTVNLPNGDKAAHFNGTSEYLSVPSDSSLSISTNGELTVEGWVRADTLSFAKGNSSGYTDWMGKCQIYSPTCEWEQRFYGSDTAENRPQRFSAYAFNPSSGLGSGADWQPESGTISAGQWVHVVAEYQTKTTPSQCRSAYPGTISIWVNGIKQDFAEHAPTGCMSQFSVSPVANNSPLNIGTMALDYWFPGAVGKVAVYDHLLSQSQINKHFTAMTGASPAGSCGVTCSLTTAIIALLKQ